MRGFWHFIEKQSCKCMCVCVGMEVCHVKHDKKYLWFHCVSTSPSDCIFEYEFEYAHSEFQHISLRLHSCRIYSFLLIALCSEWSDRATRYLYRSFVWNHTASCEAVQNQLDSRERTPSLISPSSPLTILYIPTSASTPAILPLPLHPPFSYQEISHLTGSTDH